MPTLREGHIGLISRRTKAVAIVCVVVVFFCAGGVRSDDKVHWGVKGIATWSTIHNDTYRTAATVQKASVGLFALRELSEHWAIQPELRFVRRGDHNAAAGDFSVSNYADVSHSLNYIELPVLARYAWNVNDNARPYLIGGPVAQKCLSAKEKMKGCGVFTSFPYQYADRWYEIDEERSIETSGLEFAFLIGVGTEIQLSRSTMLLEGRFCQSLKKADFSYEKEDEKGEQEVLIEGARSQSFSFEVGYLLW